MSPPSRVLMTADAVGGVWTYALDLAAGLSEAGLAVTLVTLGPSPSGDQRDQAAAIPRLDLVETGLPLDWTATEMAEIRESAAAVRGLARSVRADLVHLNSPALAIGGGFSAPALGMCHSCLATWWAAVKDEPLIEDFQWRTHALWRGMLDCDALAAPSRAFARAVAKTYDVPQPFVVLNGRNPPPAAALPVAREPVAFISGRLWDEGKNVAALDAAAGLARTPVAAAGPLTGPDDLNRFEAAHLELLGRLDGGAIADRLARSLIYASSALYEPFGLGVLEAAQAGCALVLSDIPTFRELWNDAAVFVPPRDARAFATTIDALAADPQRAQALGAAAKARAATYSAATMVAQTLALYRHLGVASRRRTRREQAA